MDINRIGVVIKTLRKKEGLTQQQLAQKIGVTDKAVSKWERGIGVPDISVINRLANILNIDADNLLDGNLAYLESDWVGELRLDKFSTQIKISTEIYGKPSVYIYLCYFILVGVRDIYIFCEKNDEYKLRSICGNGERWGIRIKYNEKIKNSPKMIIEDAIFIYGSNLTKYFQRAMTHPNAKTRLVIPYNGEKTIYLNSRNNVSDVTWKAQGYKELPILFDNRGENEEYEMLGKGMVAINLENAENVLDVSNLLNIYKKYSGEQVYCLEEIAYRRGLIGLDLLRKYADDNKYLLKFIR